MDETGQLLLWRWSTLVQLSSLAMIAAFFALLSRSNPRAELRWWARAWSFNLLAILFTTLFWVFQSDLLLPLVALLYVGGKSAFALMLMQGVWTMIRPGARLFTTRALAIGLFAYSLAAAVILRDVNPIGFVQHTLMGVALLAFAAALIRSRAEGLTWLISGIALRGALSVAAAAAYFIQFTQPESGTLAAWVPFAASFVSASSSFDTGSEWLIVLGSVLAVSERGRRALEASNHRLVLAQDDLRRLADRDPLTGAINRRALRDVFSEVQGSEAILLFFDLDAFKNINDLHGHPTGDACLRGFANALRESFRPHDHVVRYGGDEFLVVARGLDAAGAQLRIEDVRERLRHLIEIGMACDFSVGMAELPLGGEPEQALQLADKNMYKNKHRGRR